MPRTYHRVRPNRVGSFIGGVVGIGILFFALNDQRLNGGGGFMTFWAVLVIGIVLANFYNAFSKRGIPTGTIETSEDPAEPSLNAAARLRRLEDLRKQGLLTAAEYARRHEEIVRQL